MARMIDGDAVKRRIWGIVETWKFQGRKYDALLLESVIAQIVDPQPTLTQPNEPLTIEQLREMDGEPVWIEDVKHWALIDIEKGGQWAGIPFAVWAENGAKFTYNIEGRNLHCYRRPPEGEEDT